MKKVKKKKKLLLYKQGMHILNMSTQIITISRELESRTKHLQGTPRTLLMTNDKLNDKMYV